MRLRSLRLFAASGFLRPNVDSVNIWDIQQADGTSIFKVDSDTPKITITGDLDVSGTVTAGNGLASFNGAVTNLTVVDGIVTAAS